MTTVAESSGISIAEAAARLGLTTHALRYYERDGLMLRSVQRSASGHRRYTGKDLEWIRLITRLRATGMPIREVRAYAQLVRAGKGNEHDRLALLEGHRDRVLQQLQEVARHLAAIERKIDRYAVRVQTPVTTRSTSSAGTAESA